MGTSKIVKLCLTPYPKPHAGTLCIRKHGHKGTCNAYKYPRGKWFVRPDQDGMFGKDEYRIEDQFQLDIDLADEPVMVSVCGRTWEDSEQGVVKFEINIKGGSANEMREQILDIIGTFKAGLAV